MDKTLLKEIEAMIERKIIEYNTRQGRTVSSFTVPLHRHNGSDSPKIIMGDLQYDSRGLNFPIQSGNINLSATPSDVLNSAQFIIVPPDDRATDLLIGKGGGNLFGPVSIQGTTMTILGQEPPGSNDDYTSLQIDYSGAYFTGTLSASGSTGWVLQLPDNTTLPPSPSVGQICIYGGVLQVCETAGVWTPK